MTTNLTRNLIADTVRETFPDDVADAILADTRWELTADQIASAYQHTPTLTQAHMADLSTRLERHTAVHTWLTNGAYTPARWLARNLNV